MNPAPTATGLPFHGSPVRSEAWLTPGSNDGRHRLIVFPHAGAGAAAYVAFARAFGHTPITVSIVRYPGRETRLSEPVAESIELLTLQLACELAPLGDGEFSFFGHSMGALVAFELAHVWQAQGRRPRRLWLSGRRPPHIPADRPHLHVLPDGAFLRAVRERYDALPAAMLDHPELLELILPALRADIHAVEHYRCRERRPLPVPISILRGREDRWIDADALDGWCRHSASGVDERVFPGGHFYLESARESVVRCMVAAMAADEVASAQ